MKHDDFHNGSGIYDPTVAQMFKNNRKERKQKKRDKEVRTAISQSLSILSSNDLHLEKRMVITDQRTGKVYK